jgi:uncharacterized protein (UPF0332 family)
MDANDFLTIARELIRGGTEAHWRSAAGRAYYALFLEAREILRQWGFVPPRGFSSHTFVRLRFTYPADADLSEVGKTLDRLVQLRGKADYELGSVEFTTSKKTRDAVHYAARALQQLKIVAGDATRSKAAIADLKARWP